MSEPVPFVPLDQLRSQPLEALQALWELVPTDRQRHYQQIYERELRRAEALGSDALERQINAELLRRYQEYDLVPVGSRWARTPSRVRQAAQQGDRLALSEADDHPGGRRNPLLLVVGLVLMGLMGMGLLLFNRPEAVDAMPRSPTTALTPTRSLTLTPTPLALDDPDAIIQGGDAGRTVAYPVNLRVDSAGSAPLVWVVQRRAVRAAQWYFDPDPAVASFVSGLSVRPVIGIPWSPGNAAAFQAMDQTTTFELQLNTGARLRYHFADRQLIRRSDTSLFRQIAPGLILLLIGETDEAGLPTDWRWLVTAHYPSDQELARDDGQPTVEPLPTATMLPSPTPLPLAGLTVEVVEAAVQEGEVIIRLWLYNGGITVLPLQASDFTLALGYIPQPAGPRISALHLLPFALLPDQAADISLSWRWGGEPFGSLSLGDWRWGLDFN